MTATLLVACASLVAQSRVDESYEPRVGDRPVLGLYSKERGHITRASCYATLAELKQAAEIPDPAEGEFLRSFPDTYQPRPGTRAEVVAIKALAYRRDGEEKEIDAVRVRVLEGEFKGRTLWVAPWSVLRIRR